MTASQAGKAVADAYKAALADLNPSPAKVVAIKAAPRKAARRRA